MINVKELLETLDTVANANYFIRSFKSGEMSEVDLNKLGATDYPLCFADIGEASIERGALIYSLDLLVADIEKSGETQHPQATSDTLETLHDLINQFHQILSSASDVSGNYIIEMPINCQAFTGRFDNILTGWVASVRLSVPNTNDLCIAPFS
jgi:hypothetical protein